MKSAIGADKLDPHLLLLAALVTFLIFSLFSGQIPMVWKSALVVPLHKGVNQKIFEQLQTHIEASS